MNIRILGIVVLICMVSMKLLSQTELGLITKKSLKNFDYSAVADKKILIYLKPYKGERKISTGEFSLFFSKKVKLTAEERVKIWEKGFESSNYSASDFEITHDLSEIKALIRKRDRNYLFMRASDDDFGNDYMKVFTAYPKQMVVASVLTNQFNLTSEEDIRLMFNLLNSYFEDAIEVQSKGVEKRKLLTDHALQSMSDQLDNLKEMTFLVPKIEGKNEKKTSKLNAEIKNALRENWKICPYEIVSTEDIAEKRLNHEEGYFYWRPLIINPHMSVMQRFVIHHILTTNDDSLIATTMSKGGYKLKAKSINTLQDNILKLEKRIKKKLN